MGDNDRELLELAAKAAGLSTRRDWYDALLGVAIPGDQGCAAERWNPLENDGDAFRLVVKLGIFGPNPMLAHFLALERFGGQEHDDCTAYRRAVVRVAAELKPDVAQAMAAEYEAWVAFYHRGDGDYADFLRQRAPKDGVDLGDGGQGNG